MWKLDAAFERRGCCRFQRAINCQFVLQANFPPLTAAVTAAPFQKPAMTASVGVCALQQHHQENAHPEIFPLHSGTSPLYLPFIEEGPCAKRRRKHT